MASDDWPGTTRPTANTAATRPGPTGGGRRPSAGPDLHRPASRPPTPAAPSTARARAAVFTWPVRWTRRRRAGPDRHRRPLAVDLPPPPELDQDLEVLGGVGRRPHHGRHRQAGMGGERPDQGRRAPRWSRSGQTTGDGPALGPHQQHQVGGHEDQQIGEQPGLGQGQAGADLDRAGRTGGRCGGAGGQGAAGRVGGVAPGLEVEQDPPGHGLGQLGPVRSRGTGRR